MIELIHKVVLLHSRISTTCGVMSPGAETPVPVAPLPTLPRYANTAVLEIWIDIIYFAMHPNLSVIIVGTSTIITCLNPTVQVTYTLKSLLIAGQCFENSRDIYNRKPPNGLQLVLRTSEAHPSLTALILERTGNLEMAGQHYSDTLVMQNFGYFQLQANPGLWRLGLAAGRATQLYTVDGSKDSSDANSGSTVLEVRSFADVIHKLGVTKRPGKESVTLLSLADKDESDASFDSVPLPTSGASGGFLKSLSNIFGATKSSVASTAPSAPAASTEKLQERVHVFSLATGHMYERLLRIMMLSVSKRTSLPVKVR